jgi:adenylylsulfate kinase
VFGSGKSSAAVEIAHVLEGRNVPHAVLDLDFLTWFHTGDDDATAEHRMRLANLAPIIRNYVDAGVRYFILAGTIRERTEVDGLQATISVPMKVVRLSVPLHEIEKRLRSDVTTGRREDLRRAAQQIAQSEGVGIEDLTLSNERPIRVVALEILGWLGWK